MREKELRLALVCYGGVSLAVYMHGITKEIWRLARASRGHHAGGHDGEPPEEGSEAVYREMLALLEGEHGLRLRVLVDILAGASAGGINAIFLAQAISTGQSLDPLTDLWLDNADVDRLVDSAANPVSRLAKTAAMPLAWALSSRKGGTIDRTVEGAHRDEIRAKLANFVRARWFEPPFGGARFTGMLLDAFDAMAASPAGQPLLPDYQPLDLFVTVTEFRGHSERLRLHSPPEVIETEHRLTIGIRDPGGKPRRLGDAAALALAARATASFPGAFPPFKIAELDGVLEERDRTWSGRDAFLARLLPHHAAAGTLDQAILIDGSVLLNAPFGPAIDALKSRPAHREIDRRFVYIDPKPGQPSVRIGGGKDEVPGFFATVFGALSDIPREQPIRDNLEAIERRSSRIRRVRHILAAMRPEVEAAVERTFGNTWMLGRPTAARLAAWRNRAQNAAAREAGYGYAAYGHLKIAAVVEEIADILNRLSDTPGRERQEAVRQAIWSHVRALGLADAAAFTADGASPAAVEFLRTFDLSYRTRRLRLLIQRLAQLDEAADASRAAIERLRDAAYQCIGLYRHGIEAGAVEIGDAARHADKMPAEALAELARKLDLKPLDAAVDERLAAALVELPKPERRAAILTYLGFPFYDVATLPILQSEGLDEFQEAKVDRISPEDACAIRSGGAAAMLKGVQFNSFGAFFSRAYRENDYLWGRLHGADRLLDILASTLPSGARLSRKALDDLKCRAFDQICREEKSRLTAVPDLFEELEGEIAAICARFG
jgi:patatin-related protein